VVVTRDRFCDFSSSNNLTAFLMSVQFYPSGLIFDIAELLQRRPFLKKLFLPGPFAANLNPFFSTEFFQSF